MRPRVAGQPRRRARGRADVVEGDLEQLGAAHVQDAGVGRVTGDRVVVPALAAQPVRLGADLDRLPPVGAAVPRHPQLGVRGALRRGEEVVRVHGRDRDLETAGQVGDAVVDRRPGQAGVRRLADAVAVDAGIHHAEVRRVGDDLEDALVGRHARSGLGVDRGPRGAAVGRAEDVRAGAQAALVAADRRRGQHQVRIGRRDDDARDVVEAHIVDRHCQLRPGLAAVGRLQDAVAVDDVDAEETLAGAGIHDVGVRWALHQGRHGQVRHLVRQLAPRRARVGRLPHAAAHAGDVPRSLRRVCGIDQDLARATGHVAGTAAGPVDRLVGVRRRQGLRVLAELVAGRVLGLRAVGRDLHLVEVAGELVGETGLRLLLALERALGRGRTGQAVALGRPRFGLVRRGGRGVAAGTIQESAEGDEQGDDRERGHGQTGHDDLLSAGSAGGRTPAGDGPGTPRGRVADHIHIVPQVTTRPHVGYIVSIYDLKRRL